MPKIYPKESFSVRSKFYRMLIDSSGQGVLEYALIISLVSVAAIIALRSMGTKVNNTLVAPAASAFPN